MATIRKIKHRITAVKSTQKITRAMKMVAATKLRRAQENVVKARPYAMMLEKTIAHVVLKTKRDIHPLLTEREKEKKILLVVVTSDSGLCGSFNVNIIRKAQVYLEEHKDKQVDLYCIGRKGHDFFIKADVSVVGQHVMFFNKLKYSDAVQIIGQIKSFFLEKGYDKVDVLYNKFGSAISQIVTVKQILPLVPSELEEGVPSIDYLFEPDEYKVLSSIIPYHLEIQFWGVLLESIASAMGAKMTAMDSATENAKEFINSLTIIYNRARQTIITREINEIVGGSEGLKIS